MEKEIMDFVKNHIELLLNQTKAYQPFIKTAFPGINPSDGCFNLIVANAFSVFLGQYAIRMLSPTEQDLIDFGSLVSQYRGRVEELFKR